MRLKGIGKISGIFILVGCFSLAAIGQAQKPLAVRKVSGIVMDSVEQTIPGAIVVLTSKTDTLRTATNEDGLFFFKDVMAWEFTLAIRSLGYGGVVKVGRYSDTQPVLTMDPIVLKERPMALTEVVIDGSPSITYKTDTIEYKAEDYKVRAGANVGELLTWMEGMKVDRNGRLYYNGTLVAAARLNGKDFIDGEVTTVTKNLPAEIVSKVQIINDYGDQAARSGIKDGLSKQVLNITTRKERSLGYFTKLDGELGNDSRYNGGLTGVRINANRNLALAGHVTNTVNGVPANFSGIMGNGASPGTPGNGTTMDRSAGFSYRDQWDKRVQANMDYSYSSAETNTVTSSFYQDFSTAGTTVSHDESSETAKTDGHRFRIQLEDQIDNLNFVKISSVISYSSGVNANHTGNSFSGLIHQNRDQAGFDMSATPSFAVEGLYQRNFSKKGRNLTANLSSSIRDHEQEQDLNSRISYLDRITGSVLRDSVIHRAIARRYLTKSGRASITFSEPVSRNAAVQFLGVATTNFYDNDISARNVGGTGSAILADSLSNLFRYSYTHGRITLSYRYSDRRYDISVGTAALPVFMRGSDLSTHSGVRNFSFNLLPVFRLQYSWTLQQQLEVAYSGTPIEPLWNQVQPVRDVVNPQRPVVGNPNLKTTFAHSINSKYSNYYPNSRVGFNAGLNVGYYQDKVISNVMQMADAYQSLVYERHYLNANGAWYARANYRLSKRFPDSRYGVSFSGVLNHKHDIGRSNNVATALNQWSVENEVGLMINPSDHVQLNPSFSYSHGYSRNTLSAISDIKADLYSLKVDGLFYLMRSWLVGYDLSKTFIRGINSSIASDPFIVNSYLEKEFFRKKSLKVRIKAFDMLNQNSFINRTFTETSVTDTRTSNRNRYFMISLVGNLQKWKGAPSRNGQQLQRRGDGSFIYR